jgi:adenine phosphoribosyltransferase
VDDLLATGGTVNCVSKILESNNKEIVGILVVIELSKLQGKLKLNSPFESIVSL